jgi:hypothetical protein
MLKYDFFIAGRWRNDDAVRQVMNTVRDSGKTAYCFIENGYEGETFSIKLGSDPDSFMTQSENVPQNDPLIRKIFQKDIAAERQAANFLLVLPAGLNAHIEAGVAYGLGKKCYAVGQLAKTETLYCIFDEVFPDLEALQTWLKLPNKK